MPQIPLQLGQFGTLVGLIAPCTCDSHRTRPASMEALSSLLDLHGTERAPTPGVSAMGLSWRGVWSLCVDKQV